MTGDGGYGLKINDSGNVQIWNNVVQAAKHDIWLVQDSRRASNLSVPGHDPRQTLPDPTMPSRAVPSRAASARRSWVRRSPGAVCGRDFGVR